MPYTHISGTHDMNETTQQSDGPEQPAMSREMGSDDNRNVEVVPNEAQGNLGVMIGVILLVTFAVIALVVFASTGTADSSML